MAVCSLLNSWDLGGITLVNEDSAHTADTHFWEGRLPLWPGSCWVPVTDHCDDRKDADLATFPEHQNNKERVADDLSQDALKSSNSRKRLKRSWCTPSCSMPQKRTGNWDPASEIPGLCSSITVHVALTGNKFRTRECDDECKGTEMIVGGFECGSYR